MCFSLHHAFMTRSMGGKCHPNRDLRRDEYRLKYAFSRTLRFRPSATRAIASWASDTTTTSSLLCREACYRMRALRLTTAVAGQRSTPWVASTLSEAVAVVSAVLRVAERPAACTAARERHAIESPTLNLVVVVAGGAVQ